jgi:cytochrome oxidase Cu insertion factor (SCO1/SenC/PrrC family)
VDIQAEADKRKLDVKFLVISLDPKNDNPAQWREYRRVRDLKRDNWTFVTGNRAATDKVVATLGIKWWIFDDSIMHDFKLIRLDKDGRTAATMVAFDASAYEFLTR